MMAEQADGKIAAQSVWGLGRTANIAAPASTVRDRGLNVSGAGDGAADHATPFVVAGVVGAVEGARDGRQVWRNGDSRPQAAGLMRRGRPWVLAAGLGGVCGRAVAVQGAAAGGAGRGDRPVRAQDDAPPPPVLRDQLQAGAT